ncbi:hypothetical protein D3C85_1109380 [compost metagenome]
MGRFCCSNFVGDCPACNLEATDSEWNKRALIGLTINKGNPHFEISQPAYCAAPLSPDHSGGAGVVVLPIRQPEQDCGYTQGWNACLDKVKELNQ